MVQSDTEFVLGLKFPAEQARFILSECSVYSIAKWFSCHLEIFKQRKSEERNKDLPSEWMTGRKDRGEGGAMKIFSFLNPPPTV